ncbi:hypothetical protein Bca52824_019293 [Brassica carinata]|uniref:Uncharacterized protein n=1 Tax=Brassica carinata TaxID=52824 RepID=A0A8X7VRA2_BRACI|nr:hypothetical protein Bca52824_019293 [Brassica carinata]
MVEFPIVQVSYHIVASRNFPQAASRFLSVVSKTRCLAIAQLSRGRNKEDKDMAAPEIQSLAATALEKEYKQKAPAKLNLLSSALRSLKLSLVHQRPLEKKHCLTFFLMWYNVGPALPNRCREMSTSYEACFGNYCPFTYSI